MNSLLIIIFITYSSCLMEDYYKIYTLTKYSTTQYSSEDPSITVLDTIGIEGDMIYISFTFKENLIIIFIYIIILLIIILLIISIFHKN